MPENLNCSKIVDYTDAMGDRTLPFKIILNTKESVLEPMPGQLQKFSYDIIGTGDHGPDCTNLGCILFGICEDITRKDIVDISVVINGGRQQVIWGDNVEIKTEECSDKKSRCVGLKFNFPLSRTRGVMKVCFSLTRPYDVGPVNVCLLGGRTMATGKAICGPVCGGEEAPCKSVVYQKESVCVPVTVTPFADLGEAIIHCCGAPVVNNCSNWKLGEEKNKSSCTFTITQNLCIEIPVEFGAEVTSEEPIIHCGDVGNSECDCAN